MALICASHTGALVVGSPGKFIGTVTWDASIDSAGLQILNQPITLRLAFTDIPLAGATIAFTTTGTGPAASVPASGPFTAGTDYVVASHGARSVTYTVTFAGPLPGGAAMAMRARSENVTVKTYTGASDSFTVSMSGTRYELGGAAGGYAGPGGASPGYGGREEGVFALSSGLLVVNVGEAGHGGRSTSGDGLGGWNGGGPGGNLAGNRGAGGGGATDVRYGGSGLANRIVVAAGGGGKGAGSGSVNPPGGHRGNGGDGGVDIGEDAEIGLTGGSSGLGGGGGTQVAGGALAGWGSGGTAGSLGQGGTARSNTARTQGGGGGGGGYYGGGGGGATAGSTGGAGGGGGGSSYANLAYVGSRVGTRGVITNGTGGYALFAWGTGDLFAGDELPGGWFVDIIGMPAA